MAIRVAINHKTAYRYDRAISLSPHVFRLRPAPHARTPIEAYSLKIFPEKHFINWQQDPFGNFQARVVFPEKTNELRIEVELIARMVVINPFDFFVEEWAEKYPFSYGAQLTSELTPYLEVKEDGPLLNQWLERVDRSKKNINDFLVSLNQMVNRDIGYNIRLEPGVQTCEVTLATAFGSCRDSAWLLVQILRKLGLAARFVSGYLIQLTADIPSLDGPSGPEKDFTDLHAWTEVYIPGAGWVGLDPTSGLFAGHVVIDSTGASACVQVNFTPLGAFRFFGVPVGELCGRMVPLEDMSDAGLGELRRRLEDTADWNQRLKLAEAFIAARLRRAPAEHPATAAAFRTLCAGYGEVPVATVAARVGWSRKQLAQRFRDEVGLPPKAVAPYEGTVPQLSSRRSPRPSISNRAVAGRSASSRDKPSAPVQSVPPSRTHASTFAAASRRRLAPGM